MTRRSRKRLVNRAELRGFIGKATEFVETASEALDHQRFTAAAGNAIHAGINASDAICGAVLGERSSGDKHDDAVKLLRSVPNEGTAAANLDPRRFGV